MDKGPWELFYSAPEPGKKPRLKGVISNDFEHDVVLYVNGDFAPEQYQPYCEWLLTVLNRPAPSANGVPSG